MNATTPAATKDAPTNALMARLYALFCRNSSEIPVVSAPPSISSCVRRIGAIKTATPVSPPIIARPNPYCHPYVSPTYPQTSGDMAAQRLLHM